MSSSAMLPLSLLAPRPVAFTARDRSRVKDSLTARAYAAAGFAVLHPDDDEGFSSSFPHHERRRGVGPRSPGWKPGALTVELALRAEDPPPGVGGRAGGPPGRPRRAIRGKAAAGRGPARGKEIALAWDGGHDLDRTGALPLFRRTLVPTELRDHVAAGMAQHPQPVCRAPLTRARSTDHFMRIILTGFSGHQAALVPAVRLTLRAAGPEAETRTPS